VQEDIDYYRIGTIARMTGLSVERLRAWERRYELVPAHREGKTRYYSRDQLERLQKIKRLVDAGHSISSLVDLSDQHLDARLSSRTTSTAPATLRVGIVGASLVVAEQTKALPSRLSIEERWSNIPAFMTTDPELSGHFDVLVAQVTVLSPETVVSIRKKTGKIALVLLYQFATVDQIRSVQDEGIPVLRWPASWDQIETACSAVARTSLLSATAAVALFSDDELIAIAASDKQATGLPRYLVDAILQLNNLSEFALDCADQDSLEGGSTSVNTAEQVHVEVTRARAQLETALQLLVQSERLQATAH